MELKIDFTGEFTRAQIRTIASAHPELGEKLAATAYLAGQRPTVVGRRVAGTNARITTKDDTLFRVNQRKPAPAEGTNMRKALDELITQFANGEFMYINVKEATQSIGGNSGLPAHLRNLRFIIPA